MAAAKTLAIIVGAGPGTGAALGAAFARTHDVALLARSLNSLNSVAESIKKEGGGVAEPFACDATSSESVKSAFAEIKKKFPDHQGKKWDVIEGTQRFVDGKTEHTVHREDDLKVACYNVAPPFVVKPFLELDVQKDVTPGINLSINGAFYFSQAVIPLMLEHKTGGTIIFSGATAGLKGGAKFAAFAPSKFALRGLSQSLAREFGPQGIHVAHTILDGLIATDKVSSMVGDAEPDSRLAPSAIANAYVYLSQQEKSCWTQEIDLRPFAEKF